MSDRCQTYIVHRPERPPGPGARGGPAGQAAGDAPQTPAARPSAARGPPRPAPSPRDGAGFGRDGESRGPRLATGRGRRAGVDMTGPRQGTSARGRGRRWSGKRQGAGQGWGGRVHDPAAPGEIVAWPLRPGHARPRGDPCRPRPGCHRGGTRRAGGRAGGRQAQRRCGESAPRDRAPHARAVAAVIPHPAAGTSTPGSGPGGASAEKAGGGTGSAVGHPCAQRGGDQDKGPARVMDAPGGSNGTACLSLKPRT